MASLNEEGTTAIHMRKVSTIYANGTTAVEYTTVSTDFFFSVRYLNMNKHEQT